MRVSVDLDLCQGHGVCESEAPEVFELGKNQQVTILRSRPDESMRPMVEAAVKFCPTSALRITDDAPAAHDAPAADDAPAAHDTPATDTPATDKE